LIRLPFLIGIRRHEFTLFILGNTPAVDLPCEEEGFGVHQLLIANELLGTVADQGKWQEWRVMTQHLEVRDQANRCLLAG
jgi:hypothetical protein